MNVFDAATTFPLGDASLDNMSGASPMVVQNMLDLPQRTTGCWEGVAWETGVVVSPQQHQQWTTGGSSGNFVNCFMPSSPRCESRMAVSTSTVHGVPRVSGAEIYPVVAATGSRANPPTTTQTGGPDNSAAGHLDNHPTEEIHERGTAALTRAYNSDTSWYSATGPAVESSNANKVCMVSHPIASNVPKLQTGGASQHTPLPQPVQPAAPNAAATTGQLYRPIVGAPCTLVGSCGDRNGDTLLSIKGAGGGPPASVILENNNLINEGMSTTAAANTAANTTTAATAAISSSLSTCAVDEEHMLQCHSTQQQQLAGATGHNTNVPPPNPHMTANSSTITLGGTHTTVLAMPAMHKEASTTDEDDSQNSIKCEFIHGLDTVETTTTTATSTTAFGTDGGAVGSRRSAATAGLHEVTGEPKVEPHGGDGFCGAGGGAGAVGSGACGSPGSGAGGGACGGEDSPLTRCMQQCYTGSQEQLLSEPQSAIQQVSASTAAAASDIAEGSSITTAAAAYAPQQPLDNSNCSSGNVSGGVYSASSGEEEMPIAAHGGGGGRLDHSPNHRHHSHLPPDRHDGIPICLTQDMRLTVLVNRQQHSRILKRRLQRQKFRQREYARESMRPHDMQCSVGLQERAYIHESRHLHAKRRPRGPGGRFLPTDKQKKRQV